MITYKCKKLEALPIILKTIGDYMNIYQIAEKCGVSISTVSRVINNSGAVSKKTREKVEKAIEEENFVPSSIARSLASNESKSVGLMVPDIRNFFHTQVAYEIDDSLNSLGYTTILCNTGYSLQKKIEILKLQEEKRVDALITVGSAYGDDEFENELIKISKKIPVVQINNYCKDLICVYCDEKSGIRQALEKFKYRGCQKPIFISENIKYETRAYRSKKHGFNEALKDFYPSLNPIEFKIKNFSKEVEEIYEFIIKEGVDAIQFENDNLAIKFFGYLTNKGIRIPNDLALVGFDNIDATNYTYKKISSIDHKIKEHVNVAIAMLMKSISDKKSDINFRNIIKSEFVEKETT